MKKQLKDTILEKLLWRGIRINSPKVVNFCLRRGVDPNTKTKDGLTALMYAAFRGKADVVKILISKEADTNAKDEQGRTALDWALRPDRQIMEAAYLVPLNGPREFRKAVQAARGGNYSKTIRLLN